MALKTEAWTGSADGVQVCLLGPVRIRLGNREVVPPSPTQRRLLALLALRVNRPIDPQLLRDRLEIGAGALRNTVARLRRLVPAEFLRTLPTGYVLDASVDAVVLDGLLRRRDAEPAVRLEDLETALAMVAGLPLEEFRDEEWARSAAARLDECVAHAREEHAGALIELGRWSPAVGELEGLVAEQPARDRARRLLMEALAGAGRQADALAVYADYHRHLAREYGTDPPAGTREIQHRIAAAAEPSSVEQATEDMTPSPRSAAASVPAGFLPRYRSTLIGRDEFGEELQRLLASSRLLTLTGPGGVGKTRLAIRAAQAAHAAGSRVWFAGLAAVAEDADVLNVITGAIGESGATAAARALAGRRGLLVIDNCEHVITGVSAEVEQIIDDCPEVTVLLTSREPLGVDGEHVVVVPPLPISTDGTDLFITRATAAGARIGPADAEDVAQICARLGGLPLAIEIAATRAAAMGVRPLLDSLDERLHVLGGITPSGVAADRQRPLRGGALGSRLFDTIGWSYDLLSAEEQMAFRVLSIFPDGFEMDAAVQVLAAAGVAAEEDVPGLIFGLTHRSMLAGQDSDTRRLRLLEPLRAYALGRLHVEDDPEMAAQSLAGWVATLTSSQVWDLYSWSTHRRAVRLEREVAAWIAAARHARSTADRGLAARLCGASAGLLALGRPDLAVHLEHLDELLDEHDPGRLCLPLARWMAAHARKDTSGMQTALQSIHRRDPGDSRGMGRLLESARLILLTADVDAATALRRDAFEDDRVPPGVRDSVLVNLLYGVAMTNRWDLEPDGWRERARQIARGSDVPSNRQLGHLALTLLLWDSDREAAVRHLRAAAAERGDHPRFLRRIWRASTCRLLLRVDTVAAAAGLRDLLTEQIRDGLPDDHTTLVTCAALLAAADHPEADDAVASVALVSSYENLARTMAAEEIDERRRRGNVIHPDALTRRLLAALDDVRADLSHGDDPPAVAATCEDPQPVAQFEVR